MQSMKRQPLTNFYHRTFCASCTNAVSKPVAEADLGSITIIRIR